MAYKNEQVAILCGGKGTRLREHTETIPKALVPIGGLPVIVHVMKIYEHYGFNKFIFCLGYKGDAIKQFFLEYDELVNDFKLSPGKKPEILTKRGGLDRFEITFAETGLETQTGGRIKKIEKYIENDTFLATYTDGVADINITRLFEFHRKMGKKATLTGVQPTSSFGILEVEKDLAVTFKEKPALSGRINGGFFCFERALFDYLEENSILEEAPLKKLSEEKQLAVYPHDGFWACMDTFKDYERLNALWEKHYMPHLGITGKPPWKVWND